LALQGLLIPQGRNQTPGSRKIENIGSEGIRIADPGSDAFGPDFTLFLKYGEKQLIEDGFTPAPIEIRLALYPKSPAEPTRFKLIASGFPWEIEFSADLEGQAPRGWIVRLIAGSGCTDFPLAKGAGRRGILSCPSSSGPRIGSQSGPHPT
jgi:hypothetical protein